MIGIQLVDNKATVAACTQAGTEVLATGIELSQVAKTVAARTGAQCKSAVIGVPAYYNDELRKEVLQNAREAGIPEPRLMNEPSAVALAYGSSQSQMPENALVLTLSNNGAFDATLVAFQEGLIEVTATNGILKIEDSTISNSEKLVEEINPILTAVLRDGECSSENLSAVILAGKSSPLKRISKDIESTSGKQPVEPPAPQTAIACGAATYSLFLERSTKTTTPEAAQAPSGGSGCLGPAVLVGVAIIGIITVLCRFAIQS